MPCESAPAEKQGHREKDGQPKGFEISPNRISLMAADPSGFGSPDHWKSTAGSDDLTDLWESTVIRNLWDPTVQVAGVILSETVPAGVTK